MNIERKKTLFQKQLCWTAVCICAICAVGIIIINVKPVFCDEIIDSEHQTILTTKPANIVSAGFWMPTKEQTAEALSAVDKYLTTLSKAQYSDMPKTTPQNSTAPTKKQISIIRNSLWKYRVQFMGINFDKRKVIYCNFFIYDSKKHAKWKNEYVDVSAGGTAFWQIDYEEKTKLCSDLTINSEDLKPKTGK